MYEMKLFRLVVILGIFGGIIGYFFNKLEIGLIIGLAMGSLYMALQKQRNSGDG